MNCIANIPPSGGYCPAILSGILTFYYRRGIMGAGMKKIGLWEG